MEPRIKEVVFRVDASIEIGTGHVMRCLTLADMLRANGVNCRFICRMHKGHLIDFISKRGYELITLAAEVGNQNLINKPKHAYWLETDWETDAIQTCSSLGPQIVDWLIVDHYALDFRWEKRLRHHCHRLMVIDDLADRQHDCDLLLDQNLGRQAQDYKYLVKPETEMLLGSKFSLLRPDFAEYRTESLVRRESPVLQKLLITMGGVDKDNIAGKVLKELQSCQLPDDLEITVVMGSRAPWINEVREQALLIKSRTKVLVDVSNMAKLMAESDLAIGAAGGTSWERCCLGLPSIVIVLADNQKSGAAELSKVNAAIVIENIGEIKVIFDELSKQEKRSYMLSKLSASASRVTDGFGVEKVINNMMVNYD